MKKIIYCIGAAFIAVVIIGLILFVLTGPKSATVDTPTAYNIEGIWNVVEQIENGVGTLVQEEYMVFGESNARDYRDGSDKPYAESSFTIKADGTLDLPDISRSYKLNQVSEYVLRLYQSDDTYTVLVSCADNERKINYVGSEALQGTWNVTYRDGSVSVDETLVFHNNIVMDYRDGNETPYMELEYTLNSRILTAPAANIEMVVCLVNSNTIILVQTDGGYIWELHKNAE